MSDTTGHHTAGLRSGPGITEQCFPTPHLAVRGTADQTRVRVFATEQARAAREVHDRIATRLSGLPTAGRVVVLTAAYDAVVRWRRAVAVSGDARYDSAGRAAGARYAVTLDQDGPNLDRLGGARLRADARWDTATRRWTGGSSTPASRILDAYQRAALARFAVEAPDSDVLDNQVTLPSGGRVAGNTLLRGAVARDAAEALAERLYARRGVSQVETAGDLLYAVTAPDRSRRLMFAEAMTVLATAGHGDTAAWWQAAYLLYQAPQYKKGSDAVARVFLVAVGTALLGRPVVLPHDLDLACMVLGQTAVVAGPLACGGAA
ncbi:hypothetical protein [Actinosynnema sp. NPDC023587]|uniref:hypothetical protein n=1 Tax=Actinosynnema sp. NPDC023587 TaxID=3154695 RepID=UPI00340923D2